MKLYGVYNMDECRKMMLGQPRLVKVFTNLSDADSYAKKLSKPAAVSYSANDSYFHSGQYPTYEQFVSAVKSVKGFVGMADNVGNNSTAKAVIYDKNLICNSWEGYGVVLVRKDVQDKTVYEVKELEVEETSSNE